MAFKKRFIILITAFVFVAFPLFGTANAEYRNPLSGQLKTDPAAMLVDVVSTRPLGAASIVLGTATFVVCLPFSVLGGNTDETFHSLIAYPVKYTFFRPVGNI